MKKASLVKGRGTAERRWRDSGSPHTMVVHGNPPASKAGPPPFHKGGVCVWVSYAFYSEGMGQLVTSQESGLEGDGFQGADFIQDILIQGFLLKEELAL